jgi:uncharacterized membrane protein (DUF4010 family)
MTLVEVAQQLVFAILFGALIGIEREHTRIEHKQKGLPIFGIRTTIVFAILGFVCAFVSKLMNNSNLIVFGIILALVITTVVYLANVWTRKYTGSTTYVAMFVVFFLGVLAGLGGKDNFIMGGIIAIITTLFLAAKRKMMGWVRKLTNEEIFSALKFGIIAFIIFPLLPNYTIDPWGIINPTQIWFVVVAVSAISFLSYILMKEFSHKGIIVSSFFGGLFSGSATAYQVAEWVRKKRSLLSFAKPGIILACITGHIGDLIVVAFVIGNFLLLRKIALAYVFGLVSMAIMFFILYKKHSHVHELNISSPFAIVPALKFGAAYLSLTVFAFLLKHYFGTVGLIPVIFAGSLISSSAVIASMATLSRGGGLGVDLAAQMVILAMVVSLLIKYFWVQNAKNKNLSRTVLLATAITSVMVVVGFLLSQKIL